MNTRSLFLTATQTPAIEITDTNNVVAGFVTEAITVQATAPIGTLVGAVVSAPVGSVAEWFGSDFTPDVPGDYVLTAANGAAPAMKFTVRAMPAAALTATVIKDPFWHNHTSTVSTHPLRTQAERRAILRKLVLGEYGAVSAAALAGLTTQAPVPTGLNLPKGV